VLDNQTQILSYHTPAPHAGTRRIWRVLLSILIVLIFTAAGGIAGGAAANQLFGSYDATLFLQIPSDTSNNPATVQSTAIAAVASLRSRGFFSQAYSDLDAPTARHFNSAGDLQRRTQITAVPGTRLIQITVRCADFSASLAALNVLLKEAQSADPACFRADRVLAMHDQLLSLIVPGCTAAGLLAVADQTIKLPARFTAKEL